MTSNDIHKLVDELETKHPEGLTYEEIYTLIELMPKDFNMKKYEAAMMGNTCIMRDNQLVIYHCDVIRALICGLENRNLTILEWD